MYVDVDVGELNIHSSFMFGVFEWLQVLCADEQTRLLVGRHC